jgi:hypothetical protein
MVGPSHQIFYRPVHVCDGNHAFGHPRPSSPAPTEGTRSSSSNSRTP